METLRITGMTAGLVGVGRLEDGRAVFVPDTLPGETVRCERTRDRGRYCEARLLSVQEPSPERVDIDCPWSGQCGGCAGRHMSYEASLRYKQAGVRDALTRIGRLPDPPIREILASCRQDRTRNKAEYAIEGELIGPFARGSHRILPIDDCLQQSTASIRVMRAVRQWIRRHPEHSLRFLVTRVNRAGEVAAVLSSATRADLADLDRALRSEVPQIVSVHQCVLRRRPAHALDGLLETCSGPESINETLMGLRFELSPRAFLQVHHGQAERLYRCAMDFAGLRAGERAADVYCGVGTITLCLARQSESVYGVELVPEAVRNARKNARINGLADRVQFACGDAASLLPAWIRQGNAPDVVSVDPPRRGCDGNVLSALLTSRIPRIVYISCDPATLARDLQTLVGAGAYRIEAVQPVDMFPKTGHIETIVLLQKLNS